MSCAKVQLIPALASPPAPLQIFKMLNPVIGDQLKSEAKDAITSQDLSSRFVRCPSSFLEAGGPPV
jgi:hypothetical protein